MLEWLQELMPNVFRFWSELMYSSWQTIYMVLVSGGIALFFGMIVGVTLVVTKQGGILENKIVNFVVGMVINVFRSIPFVILIVFLLPVTRIVMGTPLGVRGALFPLIIGTIPFLSRQIESALTQLSSGLIEAAVSMGASPLEIILKVYLRESLPTIILGSAITFISLIGLTAMVGAVAGGGLGDFVLQYGRGRNMTDITYVSIIIILLMVTVIQTSANLIVKKITH
jgi:D-methionine transport system permease protein